MEASRTEVVVGFKKKKSVGPCASGEWVCVIFFPWVPTSLVSASLGVRQRETHTECVDTVMLAGREATQF